MVGVRVMVRLWGLWCVCVCEGCGVGVGVRVMMGVYV